MITKTRWWVVAALLTALVPAPASAAPADDSSDVAKALRLQARLSGKPSKFGTNALSAAYKGGAVISAGADVSCSGAAEPLWCWGGGDADPARVDSIPDESEQVETGRAHTCVLNWLDVDDPGGKLYCWGDNDYGQLGDGTTDPSTTSVLVAQSIVQVAAGADHTCALTAGQTVSCWGRNDAGQLGLGTSGAPELTPQPVPGLTDIESLAAGGDTTCAIDEDGAPWCWGSDASGQIGDGAVTTAPATVPTKVTTTDQFLQLDVGREHVCGMGQDAPLWCWGSDSKGQLGDDTPTADQSEPVEVTGLDDKVWTVSTGGDSTCVVLGDGTARCWGDNASGQLGVGDRTDRSTPAEVDQTDVPESPFLIMFGLDGGMFEQLAVGDAHTCALDVQGNAYCWGSNASGQLGDGTTDDRLIPGPTTLVPDPPTDVEVRSGNGSLGVTWAKPDRLGAGTFLGYAALAWGNAGQGDCDTKKLGCKIESLVNGEEYRLFVAVGTDAGFSTSAMVPGIPIGPASTPPAPGGGGGQLPITGVAVSMLIMIGGALVVGGLILRRRT